MADIAALAKRNRLLVSLPRTALAKMLPDLQLRAMHVRAQVVVRGEPIVEVFFPLNCVLSTVAQGTEGQVVEVATIGNEGMAGLPIFLGAASSAMLETFAQVSGDALVMRAKEFRAHLDELPRLTEVMGLYTQALIGQVAQASACNRMHPADERCARWLLMTHDRVGQDEFELTQEFLAQMLGVRRATVSEVANALQSEGIIRYSRGSMTILNREALAERSCECYRVIREEYERLLG
jgi:CRP-like cAMP-binding protein